MSKVDILCVSIMALIYGGSGIVELPQWNKLGDQFNRWGFPRWWAVFNSALKVLAAGLILMPRTRVVGVALCVIVAFCAAATVLRFKERALYKPVLAVVVVTLLGAVQLLGKGPLAPAWVATWRSALLNRSLSGSSTTEP